MLLRCWQAYPVSTELCNIHSMHCTWQVQWQGIICASAVANCLQVARWFMAAMQADMF